MIYVVNTMPVGVHVHQHPHIWIGFIGSQKYLRCQLTH